ncbi:TrbI/VirB10 family protein [Enterobacter ludwigii]
MSNDTSPNGLIVKTAPRTGYLGGAVSRKLLGIIGFALFALVMFIMYVISQKGHHDAPADDDAATLAQGKGQDDAGLQDILNGAPDTSVVRPASPPPVAETAKSSPAPRTDTPPAATLAPPAATAAPAESESDRQRRLAYEQELEQIHQQKTQAFLSALTAKSAVSFDTSDEQGGSSSGKSARSGSAVPAVGPVLPASGQPQEEDPNKQDVKMDFAKQEHSNTYLNKGREAPLSPYELKVGTLIPATMISGLNSDLPGQIIASVSQNVYDSATGGHLLIPQGSKLYGMYDSQIAYGQDRVLVAWTRVNYPDGTTLELKGMGAIDAAGYAGFADQVDHHYWKIFGNAFVLGMITGATEAGVSDGNSDDTSTAEAVNNGVAEQFSETGSTLIEKNLDVQPTITIRSGYKFNIMLNKDAVLAPYQPIDE